MALSFVTPVVGSTIFTAEAVGTGTSPAVTEPTGTAPGDFLICICVAAIAGAMVPPPNFRTVAGFLTGTSVANVWWGIARRYATPITATLTLTGSVYREVYLFALHSNVTWPVCDTRSVNISINSSAGPINPDPPIISAQGGIMPCPAVGQGPGIYVVFGMWWGGSNAGGWTPPASYTTFNSNTAGEDVCMAYKTFTTPSAEDPAAFANATGTITSDSWNGATVALVEAAPTYYMVGKRVVQRVPSQATGTFDTP